MGLQPEGVEKMDTTHICSGAITTQSSAALIDVKPGSKKRNAPEKETKEPVCPSEIEAYGNEAFESEDCMSGHEKKARVSYKLWLWCKDDEDHWQKIDLEDLRREGEVEIMER